VFVTVVLFSARGSHPGRSVVARVWVRQAWQAPDVTSWCGQPLHGPIGHPTPACDMSVVISAGVNAPPG
jgi:hypothetical protein